MSESHDSHERHLLGLPVRRPVTVLMAAVAVGVFGWTAYTTLPMDLMPKIDYPTLTVRTEYPAATPEQVEQDVARELEQALANLEHLQHRSSVSRAERCDVILQFSWDTNMDQVLLDVREKLDRLLLPAQVEHPRLLRYDPNLEPVLRLALSTAEDRGPRTLFELREYADEVLVHDLTGIDGLAALRVTGGREAQVEVRLIEARLRQFELSAPEVAAALRRHDVNMPAGLLRDGRIEYLVRTLNEYRTLDDLRRTPIVRRGARDVFLADLAEIAESHREEQVLTRVNGRPAVIVEVYREADANIVALARAVRERLFGPTGRKRRPGEAAPERPAAPAAAGAEGRGATVRRAPRPLAEKLPAGIALDVLSDQSGFIENAVNDVKLSAVFGGLLAVTVILLFLRSARDTLIIAVSIPLSMLATFFPMKAAGVSLNLMSLGGLALGCGMLVDNGIVVIESIRRCREEGDALRRACLRGTREVGGAVFASTLTTVCVFFPIGFVEGIAGQLFRDQALTVVFSLMFSLLVALFVIPMLASRAGAAGRTRAARPPYWQFASIDALRAVRAGWRWRHLPLLPVYLLGRGVHFAGELAWKAAVFPLLAAVVGTAALVLRGIALVLRVLWWAPNLAFQAIMTPIQAGYPGFLRAALRMRAAVLLLCGGLGALAVWAGGGLGVELLPELTQGQFTATVSLPPGADLAQTDAAARRIEARLERALALPAAADQPPLATRRDTLLTTIGAEAAADADAAEGEHTMKFTFTLHPDATDAATERAFLDRMAQAAQVPGVQGAPAVSRPSPFSFRSPLEIHVFGDHLPTLQRMGLAVEQRLAALPALRNVRSNIQLGRPELHLEFDRLKLQRAGLSLRAVADTLRNNLQGETVSQMEDRERKIDILLRLRAEDRETEMALRTMEVAPNQRLGDLLAPDGYRKVGGPSEIRREGNARAAVITADLAGLDLAAAVADIEAALADLRFPERFHAEIAGQWREFEQSRTSLFAALALAVFLVYVVMACQFESLVQPLIIMGTMPLALVGVVLALWGLNASGLAHVNVSVMVLLGVIVLMGIVVNNGIVLIDYVNQLRARGLPKEDAIVLGARARLRPILMTMLTTVLALLPLTGVLPLGPPVEWLREQCALGAERFDDAGAPSGDGPAAPGWDRESAAGGGGATSTARDTAARDGASVDGRAPLADTLRVIARELPPLSGQGLEMRMPMAVTVIAGLLFSTILTLVVIPCVYSLVDRRPDAALVPVPPTAEHAPRGA